MQTKQVHVYDIHHTNLLINDAFIDLIASCNIAGKEIKMSSKHFPHVIFCSLIVVFFISCSSQENGGGITQNDYQEVKSSLERNLDPEISPSDVETLVQGNTAFAISLYHQLCGLEGDANIFYSPYSISAALAMLFAGAEANTEMQMADTLNFTLPEASVHEGFNYLDIELQSRGQDASSADGGEFQLNIANAVWGQEGYDFQSDFLNVLAVNYAAGLFVLDFIREPEKSRLTINKWVAEKTEDKILDLLPEGSVNPFTRMVLTNAVYFNAAWANPFLEELTQNEPFYLLDESEITVPMMQQVGDHGYADSVNFQAVSLLYDGLELEMIIIIPDSGEFEAVESSLDSQLLSSIIDQMQSVNIDISIPKWEYKSKFTLDQVLSAMGMPDAFNTGTADFSGINGGYDLFVQAVFHQAFVKVNEAGTEAAAATGIIIGETSVPPPPTIVKADRPFIYLIRDIQTRTVLFVGRVMNPEEE